MTRHPAIEERLQEDVLFLACTRPAMVGGAPMEAVAVNVIASAVVFLATRSPLCLLIAPTLHLVARAICKHDHNAFRILWLWLQTRGRARTVSWWGGASMSPLPLRRRFSAHEALRG